MIESRVETQEHLSRSRTLALDSLIQKASSERCTLGLGYLVFHW